jgi:ribosomal protein S3
VEAPVAAGSQIVTDNDRRAETEAAEDAAVRAARPILLAGNRGAEADRLRAELEELTGKRVRLDIWEAPDPNAG